MKTYRTEIMTKEHDDWLDRHCYCFVGRLFPDHDVEDFCDGLVTMLRVGSGKRGYAKDLEEKLDKATGIRFVATFDDDGKYYIDNWTSSYSLNDNDGCAWVFVGKRRRLYCIEYIKGVAPIPLGQRFNLALEIFE